MSARPPRRHAAFLGGPGVTYEELLPPPEWRPWVAVLWRIRSEVRFELTIAPDGCMDIIGRDVIGSLTQSERVTLEPGGRYEGMRFHPGGLPALTGIPASELVDARLPIADLLPSFRSLENLAADAAPPDPLATAVAQSSDVRSVARDSGYSPRQLRRRVIAATGHAPKRLMRIGRMQRVLIAGRGESWARTAADHGFFDEAHMANDIRELAGATPHALVG